MEEGTQPLLLHSKMRDVLLSRGEAQGVRRYKAQHGIPPEPLPMSVWRRLLRTVEPPHHAYCWCTTCWARHELDTLAVDTLARPEL